MDNRLFTNSSPWTEDDKPGQFSSQTLEGYWQQEPLSGASGWARKSVWAWIWPYPCPSHSFHKMPEMRRSEFLMLRCGWSSWWGLWVLVACHSVTGSLSFLWVLWGHGGLEPRCHRITRVWKIFGVGNLSNPTSRWQRGGHTCGKFRP